MMPRERGGVVDSRLNVYGVRGLKVAGTTYTTGTSELGADLGSISDLSIAPANVSAVSILPDFTHNMC